MKRLLLITGLLAFAASCQKFEGDSGFGNSGQEVDVQISVSLPEGLGTVKSQEDPGAGDLVNRCIMEVYLDGKLYGERIVTGIENKKASIDTRLLTGKDYKLVFWADCAEGSSPEEFADKHYSTADLSNVTILDPEEYFGSDDERDAFFAVEDFNVDNSKSITAELRRPFGQLNVKTLDLLEVPVDLRPSKVSVAFAEVPSGINLLTGELTGETVSVEYNESHVIDGTSGDLTFDYIFAPAASGEQRLVNYTMSFFNEAGSEAAAPYEFTNIPVQRNYRTIVSGNLLTEKASISVSVVPAFGQGDIEVTGVSNMEELNAALAGGAESVVLSQVPEETDSELIIPHNYSSADKQISIDLPRFDEGKTLTVNYASDLSGNAPDKIVIKSEYIDALVINTEESTVVIDGSFGSITATTADNTLVVSENCTISSLTLAKGNLKLYGTVKALSKETGWAGTIYRCFDSQTSFDNLVADNVSGYSEILVENPVDGIIDGGNANFTRQMTISAPLTINNFRIDVDYAGAYGLKIIEGASEVSMDNVIVTSTSKASRTVWIEVEKTDCHFSNSKFIAPTGTSDKSSLNLVVTSSTCVQNVSLDNVLLSIDEQRLNVDAATDYQYSDELKNRVPAYSRGVTVGHSSGLSASATDGAVVNLSMTDSAIESLYYSINVVQTKARLNLDAENCVFDGRATLNLWGQSSYEQYLNLRNSKLIGRNWFSGSSEEFATLVVNYQARNYYITLDNCDVVSDNNPQTDKNRQYMASLRSPFHNKLTIKNGTIFRETVNPRLDHAIDIDDDSWINEIVWDETFTLACTENTSVLPSNVWNGSLSESTAMPSEEDGKYYIGTPGQLADWVSEKRGGTAVLVRDLDLNDQAWPVSTTSNAIEGSFDGNGHTIRNLNCQTYLVEADGGNGLAWDNKAQNAALFPIFSGDIRNLTIDGATIYGSRSGALVGRYNGGTIDNCHMKNIQITGGAQKIAVLVGYAANYSDAVFSNCSVENAYVYADKNAPAGDASCMAGGFIGYLSSNNVSVTVKNNTLKNVTVKSGNLWDNYSECASHVFVGDLINISKNKKCTVTFDGNILENCTLLNAATTSLTTEFFGFYYTDTPASYPFLNTVSVDGKILVE